MGKIAMSYLKPTTLTILMLTIIVVLESASTARATGRLSEKANVNLDVAVVSRSTATTVTNQGQGEIASIQGFETLNKCEQKGNACNILHNDPCCEGLVCLPIGIIIGICL